MQTNGKKFDSEELHDINKANDLKISPFRADGKTYGTPTWIWEVVGDGEVYVRAYSDTSGRWYQSAISQKAGQIHAAGMVKDVTFEAVQKDDLLQFKTDEAYSDKYSKSLYLGSMNA